MEINPSHSLIKKLAELVKKPAKKKSVEEMGAYELYKRIQFKKQTGGNATRDLLNFHFKFALPFASVIFALLGVCVGFRKQRNASSIGVGISILVVVLYYLLFFEFSFLADLLLVVFFIFLVLIEQINNFNFISF